MSEKQIGPTKIETPVNQSTIPSTLSVDFFQDCSDDVQIIQMLSGAMHHIEDNFEDEEIAAALAWFNEKYRRKYNG